MRVDFHRAFSCFAATGILVTGCRSEPKTIEQAILTEPSPHLDPASLAAVTQVTRVLWWDRISIPPLVLNWENKRVQAMLADGTVLVRDSEKLDAAVWSDVGRQMFFALVEAGDKNMRISAALRELFEQEFLADIVEALVDNSSDANHAAIADVMKAWMSSSRVVVERDRTEAPRVRVSIPESSLQMMKAYLEQGQPATGPTEPH